jgi:hypothetical protein
MFLQVQKRCDHCWRCQTLRTSVDKHNRWNCRSSEETCPRKQKTRHPWSCWHIRSLIWISAGAFWKTIGTCVAVVRVKFTLLPAIKAQRGNQCIALLFLSPWHYMEIGGQRHALAYLCPGKRPGTHYTGGRMGVRAGLDRCRKSGSHWDSIPDPSNPQQVAIPAMLSWPTNMGGIAAIHLYLNFWLRTNWLPLHTFHTHHTWCHVTYFLKTHDCVKGMPWSYTHFQSLFYFSKFQCISHEPISVADFGRRVNRVKHLI